MAHYVRGGNAIIIKPRFWIGLALTAAVGLGAMLLGVRSGAVAPLDNAYYDSWHRLAGTRHIPANVVLVVIDETSLAQNSDPLVFWTPQVAKVVQAAREAGARVVGLDLLFSISPENWLRNQCPGPSEYDVPFRAEVASGKLVLVGSRVAGKRGPDGFLLPSPDYLLVLPDLNLQGLVGLSDLLPDQDGGIRHFHVRPPLNLAPESADLNLPRIAFAPLLASRAGTRVAEEAQGEWHKIAYAGPPGTFPRLSFDRVLKAAASGESLAPMLKNKVVVIGAEFLGTNDYHHTPYSSGFFLAGTQLMSGPEIHANIVEALMSGRRMDALPEYGQALGGLLLFALAGTCFLVMPFRLATGLMLGLLCLVPPFSLAAFQRDVWLPVMQYQLGLVTCFMAAAGYRLMTGEREKAHMRRTFSRYVSDKVVDVLLQSEKPIELGGTKQTITVLFSDIRNFTTISEKLDAQEVVEMLNRYFERTCDAVLAEGGTIDKFIGDAIMVQFGAPLPFPDHAQRAVQAALAMEKIAQEFSHWMTERFAGRDLPAFRIGIGLHTGSAVVGNIGSSKRTEYTAIGDTVNLASRIEGQTKELDCTILASEDTVQAATSVETGKTATLQVKGRDAPVRVLEITGT